MAPEEMTKEQMLECGLDKLKCENQILKREIESEREEIKRLHRIATNLSEQNTILRYNNHVISEQNYELNEVLNAVSKTLEGEEIEIVKVIFNDPVTKVYFSDGSSVVVKAMEGEKFDKTTGFVLALLKALLGNKDYYKTIKFLEKNTDKIVDVQALKKAAAKSKAKNKAAKDETGKAPAKSTKRTSKND